MISSNVRREARESLVGWTLGQITDVFHDHGFSADYEFQPKTSGERRSLVEQFYVNINWTDREHVERLLGVFEALIDAAVVAEANSPYAADSPWSERFIGMLARDGIVRDENGRLRARWVSLTPESLSMLPGDSAIPILLRRMWDSVYDDPDAAIGAAKEAIEATAKSLLLAAGEAVGPAETMPALISRAQRLLDLHPTSVGPDKQGAETIKAILGALSRAALGINELRRDYGTGHGRVTRPSGLTSRHAQLAAQAADAWVRFLLETSQARSQTHRVAS